MLFSETRINEVTLTCIRELDPFYMELLPKSLPLQDINYLTSGIH